MAEDDLRVVGLALLVGKPGFVARQRGVGAFLAFEVQFAIGGAEAHAREVVGDHAQAGHAGKVAVPLDGLIAIHAVEVGGVEAVIGQCAFHFSGTLEGFLQCPLGWDASMDQSHVAAFVVMHELLPAQPIQQLRAIRRFKDFAQGVTFFQAFDVVAGG